MSSRPIASKFASRNKIRLSPVLSTVCDAPPETRFRTRTFSPRAKPTGAACRVFTHVRTGPHVRADRYAVGHLHKVARKDALPSSTCRQKNRPPSPIPVIPRLPRIWSPFGLRTQGNPGCTRLTALSRRGRSAT